MTDKNKWLKEKGLLIEKVQDVILQWETCEKQNLKCKPHGTLLYLNSLLYCLETWTISVKLSGLDSGLDEDRLGYCAWAFCFQLQLGSGLFSSFSCPWLVSTQQCLRLPGIGAICQTKLEKSCFRRNYTELNSTHIVLWIIQQNVYVEGHSE